MVPQQESKTAQGYELQLRVNSLGGFLFAQFLRPVLATTARTGPKNSVRVVCVSSSAAVMAPKSPINFNNMNYERDGSAMTKYMRSRVDSVIHAAEFARQTGCDGIISMNPITHEPKNGTYNQIFAGLSSEITEKNDGGWVAPFGRLPRPGGSFRGGTLGKGLEVVRRASQVLLNMTGHKRSIRQTW
ncbi:uncharacterized protein FOBCDRAFT_276761 [Fusarium oxysporum Fo47]|uniref:uncharacterized protein n=1 Tax=Fusarium oxysporum Fo47 TaxID=660027 RepID=UPI002869875C|nr:uncharacterized protein FOBCDRAFT_276761 [Fusarium oxysporum Fo47]WJG35738.1 hypothetical protein FOBCDRAFT_276761 [Fusarium oxysporum Fo47]